MIPDRDANVQSVFAVARGLSGGERERYLESACGGDAGLRAAVESLLGSAPNADATVTVDAGPRPRMGDDLEPGSVLGGTIRVDGVLGSGGMGTVYRATQIALARPVAVKVIRPNLAASRHALERLRREALAVARLRHPNVVTVFDFGVTSDGGAYIVMEFVEGESLAEALGREGRFPPSAALAVMRQICAAVDAAHHVGILHRDLKPHNVMLESSETGPSVKVLDFGVAKLLDEAPDLPTITGAGRLIGTPLYMSPEQCEGKPLDARSDVYALGCILYEMLTGRPPFTGSMQAVILRRIASSPEPPSSRVPEIPGWLDEAVMRALERDPDRRLASARAFARALTGPGAAREAGDSGADAATGAGNDRLRAALPSSLTSFVGREGAMRDVAVAFRASRLVTLTGLGGVGKTRLATEVAPRLLDEFRGGVWFVDLAPLAPGSHVAPAVASVLGLQADRDAEVAAAAARSFEGRPALLILDNCEHVVAAAASLTAALLRGCPGLRVLATSREVLGVQGEYLYPVGGLALPEALGPGEAERSEAVRLFVERARLAGEFRPSPDDLAAIADVCRRLDGLPLAIELAAARVRVLNVRGIRDRLSDRFRLLGAGRGGSGRQQTLRATIDWSYDLLSGGERALLDSLSVFSGGGTLEAIQAIPGEASDTTDVLDLLSSLVDKSLVAVGASGAEARFYLLETVREYAAEKLAASGRADAVRRRHRDFYLDLAESKGGNLRSSEGAAIGAILTAEIDNLRAALAWSRDESGDGSSFLRLAARLETFFYERGYLIEGRAWLEAALARAGPEAPANLRGLALSGAGNIANDQGDLEGAYAHHSEALAVYRAMGDRMGVAMGLHNIGITLHMWGEYATAQRQFDESYAICKEHERTQHCGISLVAQGTLALETGAWERADALLAESLELFTSTGYSFGRSLVRTTQAQAALWRLDFERLEGLLEDSLAVSREVESKHNIASVDLYRGRAALENGALGDAESLCHAALAQFREMGDRDCGGLTLMYLARVARLRASLDGAAGFLREAIELRAGMKVKPRLADCLDEAAALALARGGRDAAARLLGAARAVRERTGAVIQPLERANYERTLAAALSALGGGEYREAESSGAQLPLEEAVALARGVCDGIR